MKLKYFFTLLLVANSLMAQAIDIQQPITKIEDVLACNCGGKHDEAEDNEDIG